MKNLILIVIAAFITLSLPLNSFSQSKAEKKAIIERSKTELRAALNDENATVEFLKSEVNRIEKLSVKNAEVKYLIGEINRRIKKTEALAGKDSKKEKAPKAQKPKKVKTEKPVKVKAEKPAKPEKPKKPAKVKADKKSIKEKLPVEEVTEPVAPTPPPVPEPVKEVNTEVDEMAKAKEEALNAEQLEEKKELNRIFNDFTLNKSADVETILEYFANEDVPVLIKVSDVQGKATYDKPTTIRKYLEYLKDQSKNLNYIERIKFNEYNQVTELELARTNVGVSLKAPDNAPPPSLKGAMDPMRKMAVDSLALEKVRDLGKYIHIIGSKSTPFSEANRAVERAAELFEVGSTMEVSSVNRTATKTYPIKDYFKRLMSLNYDQVDITWTEIKYLNDLELLPNGKYMGVITTYQYFEGKSGGQLVYKDKTIKDVTVYVEGKKTQIGGRLVDFWDVLLGDVKVAETIAPPVKD